MAFPDPVIFSTVRKPKMGFRHNSRNAPGETKSPTPHQPAEMSNSDTNQEQTREEKVELMDSMCVMVKGKQTYLGLRDLGASVDRSRLS